MIRGYQFPAHCPTISGEDDPLEKRRLIVWAIASYCAFSAFGLADQPPGATALAERFRHSCCDRRVGNQTAGELKRPELFGPFLFLLQGSPNSAVSSSLGPAQASI